MRAWLAKNPTKRIRHGTKREDGKFFCGYSVGYKNGEYWSDQKTFETRLRLSRETMRKRRKDPTYRLEYSEYCRQRYAARHDVREKTAKRLKQWANDHHDRINQRAASRRARKRNLTHETHDESLEEIMHAEARKLTQKTGIEHHVDHIIPIKHGGAHHHLNLQVLPCDVNFKKNANPFWTSETYKDFRSVPQELWPEALVDFYLAMRSV